MPIDQNTLITGLLVVVFVVMIIFMFRNSRKRQRDAAEMQSKLQPGADILTSTGFFGKLISIDEDSNEAIIETTPGVLLRVHRQTLSRVVEPTVAESDASDTDVVDAHAAPELNQDHATHVVEPEKLGEPEYGQRVDEATAKPKRAPRSKPAE